jgi:zinc transport system substrate-binding protein
LDGGVTVVATSSWTAAYASAAGAENVVTLAPFNMAHPSEYELRPGDIPILTNAGMILYAGYEVMAERLKKGLDLPPEKLLRIDTDYSYASMEKSIMQIAAGIGTESIARENLLTIRRLLDKGRKALDEKRLAGQPVTVHRFQASLAKELGLTPVLIFGPGSPEASAFVAVSKTEAAFIMDNIHNPVGQPFKEILPNARYVQLLNFPGQKGTKSLTDVIQYNISQLIQD